VVEAVSPERLLVKLPGPVPSDVLVLNETVGPEEVLQQTPRADIVEPPSDVVTPPDTAVVEPIAVIAFVTSAGTVGVVTGAEVVNVTSFP
jgi:hypothetical protein